MSALAEHRVPLYRNLRVIGTAVVVSTIAIAVTSVFVGATDVSPRDVLSGSLSESQSSALFVSRIPRTIAIVLAGSAMAVAGLVMQLVVRNRFVEPSSTGTTAGASAGILAVLLVNPGASIVIKLLMSILGALAASALFIGLIAKIPARQGVLVPLVGIMTATVIEAGVTFVALKQNLLQAIGAWTTGNFAPIIAGRYELLFLVAGASLAIWVTADRLTIVALGEDTATSLGVPYHLIVTWGIALVAITSAVVVTVVGGLPFLGLVIPNLVSMVMGDRLRHAIRWVAIAGAGLVLFADVIGRIVVAPYELPIGTTLGVMCSAIFLALVMKVDDNRE